MGLASLCPCVLYWQYLLSCVALPWSSDLISCLSHERFFFCIAKENMPTQVMCLESPRLFIALHSIKFSTLYKHSHYSHNHKSMKCSFKIQKSDFHPQNSKKLATSALISDEKTTPRNISVTGSRCLISFEFLEWVTGLHLNAHVSFTLQWSQAATPGHKGHCVIITKWLSSSDVQHCWQTFSPGLGFKCGF